MKPIAGLLVFGLSLSTLADDGTVPDVSVTVLMMKMPGAVAADWGLDGGPAAKPETTPLKGDIPKCMTKGQARKVITGLRKAKAEIIGSSQLVIQSGQEGFAATAKEIMYLEKPSLMFMGTDGKVSVPPPPDTSGGPRDDHGTILSVTPQVALDDKTISLSMHSKLTVETREKPGSIYDPPAVAVTESRTETTLPDGCTMILMCGKPTVKGDYLQVEGKPAFDQRPYVVFVTAKVVKRAKPEGKAK